MQEAGDTRRIGEILIPPPPAKCPATSRKPPRVPVKSPTTSTASPRPRKTLRAALQTRKRPPSNSPKCPRIYAPWWINSKSKTPAQAAHEEAPIPLRAVKAHLPPPNPAKKSSPAEPPPVARALACAEIQPAQGSPFSRMALLHFFSLLFLSNPISSAQNETTTLPTTKT